MKSQRLCISVKGVTFYAIANMSDLSNKKRKRDGEGAAKPKKKVAVDAPPSKATVSSVLRPKSLPPVIGRMPQNVRCD